jgi:4'-phosphopantetheinyl transferase EntD
LTTATLPERLEAALVALGPPTVRCAAALVDVADVHASHPDEAAHVAGAVLRRRAEHAGGRTLLSRLTGAPRPIATDGQRRPVPPPGWVWSLAHDDDVVVAVATTDPEVLALGVDVEPFRALEPAMVRIIRRGDDADLDPLLLFVIKEATYKAWSVLGGRLLEHHDVRVCAGDGEAGTVRAIVPSATDGAEFHGRYSAVDGRWLALVIARSRSASSSLSRAAT